MLLITRRLSLSAMFVAIAIILMLVVRFPIFPGASFLEYDASDIPLLMGACVLGPWTALIITAVTCVLQGLFVSAQNGIMGILMHFLATGSCVLIVGLVATDKRPLRTVSGFVLGAIVWILLMIPLNLVFTPAFFTRQSVFSVVLDGITQVTTALVTFPKGWIGVGVILFSCLILVAVTAFVYQLNIRAKSRSLDVVTNREKVKSWVSAILTGIIVTLLCLLLFNLLFADVKLTGSVNDVYQMIFPIILPFNIIKAGGNSLIACIIYLLICKRINIDNYRYSKDTE